MMRIFILTGEPSGDAHGAYLAQTLRTLAPEVRLSGVGGTRMRQAGVDLIASSEHWGAIGIPEALRKVPGLWVQMQRLVRQLLADPPDVLVLIDFGAFNVRLLRRLRGHGIRTVYYIPPGSWSRHRAPGALPFLVDAIATPFPWSAENLRKAGAPAPILWVGHPLLDYLQQRAATRADARAALGIADTRPVVALVPGSRRKEVRLLLPVFFAALRRLHPTPLCLLAVAPSIGEETVRRMAPADLDIRYLDGLAYDALPAADAALVASGTATLELACLGVPMVVAYRGTSADWVQYQLLRRSGALQHIALPNILAEDFVVPELLQHAANPEGLAATLLPLLEHSPARDRQLQAFAAIRSWLGDGEATRRTAQLVLHVAAATTPEIPEPPAASIPAAPSA
ncbi:MAG TPA: lipid-A-disaccharide synthase [Armatimonadota bacterium]|jgi:lipid-A-disaccharide synthase